MRAMNYHFMGVCGEADWKVFSGSWGKVLYGLLGEVCCLGQGHRNCPIMDSLKSPWMYDFLLVVSIHYSAKLLRF